MSSRNRSWHKTPRETTGFTYPTVITTKLRPPLESWWTKPVQSREEFDQLALERSRDAGWVGKPREDGR